MSRDIVDRRSPWSTLRLVVPRWVEDQSSDGGPVEADDLDLPVVDEHGDAPARVGVADADVMKPAPVANGHGAGLVHLVEAQPPAIGLDYGAGGRCFLPGPVDRSRRLASDASVRAHVVV